MKKGRTYVQLEEKRHIHFAELGHLIHLKRLTSSDIPSSTSVFFPRFHGL